jgi:signal transduction histidine kinase
VIRLRAETTGSRLCVTVEDHGRGIPLEQKDGLFERFYRTRRNHQTEGIGLGLAIAKSIVEAHGGTIGIASEEGAGTSVWFTLPVAAACAD